MTPQTPPPINVRNFDHVTLVVSDLAATEHFYVNILGLEKTTRPAFDFQGDWYEIENILLHVILANEDSGLPGPGDRHVKTATRGQHLAFNVDDFPRASQLLSQHGIDVVAGPKERPDGASQIYIKDPDGHLIELFSLKV
jgi:catechol 2,3-dioxygenase-like lactoylglutathione lyase family enzyme